MGGLRTQHFNFVDAAGETRTPTQLPVTYFKYLPYYNNLWIQVCSHVLLCHVRRGIKNPYLRERRGTWYVRVRVPDSLRGRKLRGRVLSTHIERSLKTKDVDEANALKLNVVSDIKPDLRALRRPANKAIQAHETQGVELEALRQSAREHREWLRGYTDDDDMRAALDSFESQLGRYIRKYHDRHPETGHAVTTSDTQERVFQEAFEGIRKPNQMRLSESATVYVNEVAGGGKLTQTVNDKRRRIGAFKDWLRGDPFMSEISRADVGRYVTEE